MKVAKTLIVNVASAGGRPSPPGPLLLDITTVIPSVPQALS